MGGGYNKDEDYGESESGNWNSAKIYSRDNIAKHLGKIDDLIEICHYGTINLADEFMITEDIKIIAKIRAIKRLTQTMRMVIGNTRGLLVKKFIEQFMGFKKQLKEIKILIHTPNIIEKNEMRNGKIIKYQLNDERFDKILEILEEMHEDMVEPLNQSHLIFNPKEDEDPWKKKERIKREMVEGA